MTESARLSYGTRRWTAISSGKSAGQARSDIETIGSRHRGGQLVECGRRRPHHRRAHVGDQVAERVVVERLARAVEEMRAALVMDRRRRKARLDQLDPPTVDDRVVGRGRDRDRPAEVMGDPETHTGILPSRPNRLPDRAPARRMRSSARLSPPIRH